MAKPVTNMAVSARTRLLTIAKAQNQPFDIVLVRYALERLLYRLSISPHRNRFVLKGGLLVTLWVGDAMRITHRLKRSPDPSGTWSAHLVTASERNRPKSILLTA